MTLPLINYLINIEREKENELRVQGRRDMEILLPFQAMSESRNVIN
jgi:hypothetical protein